MKHNEHWKNCATNKKRNEHTWTSWPMKQNRTGLMPHDEVENQWNDYGQTIDWSG